MQLSTISAIGNIATGRKEHTQAVLDAGVIHHIPALLCHSVQNICNVMIL